jgi:hypothetical protein
MNPRIFIFGAALALSIGAVSAGEYRSHMTCPGAGCRHSYHRHYQPFERGAGQRCPSEMDTIENYCVERAYRY